MHGIHVLKTWTHEIKKFVQISNESMNLVSLWYYQKQQKESNVLFLKLGFCNLKVVYTIKEF
jgi:hypothetical protein